jgi:hypothetical protein
LVLRAIGIAAAVVVVAWEFAAVTDPSYRAFSLTDMLGLTGAILIIVGGTLLGPAQPRSH